MDTKYATENDGNETYDIRYSCLRGLDYTGGLTMGMNNEQCGNVHILRAPEKQHSGAK